MKKPQSIHSLLVKRLVLMSLAISLVLSLASAVVEALRLEDVARDRALVRTGVLRSLLWPSPDEQPPDPQEIRAKLKIASDSDNASALKTGHFVFLRVLHSEGAEIPQGIAHEIARAVDSKYPGIGKLTAHVEQPNSFVGDPDDKLPDVTLVWLGWTPYVQVNQVLHRSGDTLEYVQGFYDIVGPEKANAPWGLLRAFLTTLLIVLLTSLLLYPVIIRMLRQVTRLTRHLLEANLEALQVLGSTIAKRDSDTDEHNFRVTVYSVRLAEALKLDDRQIRLLIQGAFLHDVGKIGIRDSILLKPGKLDPAEFEAMKLHVAHGIDIISRSQWMNEAKAVVACHHEKVDGCGYPAGLKGDEIPLLAKIFAVADVFDALTSRRPYKKAFSFEDTITILREGSGNHFDPPILEVFLTIARPLFNRYAGNQDGLAQREVAALVDRYYRTDLGAFLKQG